MANVLFDKSALMVRNQNVLYPVTHLFVVKEETADWLDAFSGNILECYNCYPDIPGYFNSYAFLTGTRSMRFTFAYRNFASGEILDQPFPEWPPRADYSQDIFAVMWGISPNVDAFDPDYHETGGDGFLGINICAEYGYKNNPPEDRHPYLYFPDEHIGHNTDGIVTLSSTVVMTPYIDWFSEFVHTRYAHNENRTKDMVFWLFEAEITGDAVSPTDGKPPDWRFDPTDYGLANDALFTPGASGRQVISNKWKYAPWERYLGLL